MCAERPRPTAELDLALVTFPVVNTAVVGFTAARAGSAAGAAPTRTVGWRSAWTRDRCTARVRAQASVAIA